MEKWILLMTFAKGSMSHIVDIYDTEKECLEMATAITVTLVELAPKGDILAHVNHCARQSEFLKYYDHELIYTLR